MGYDACECIMYMFFPAYCNIFAKNIFYKGTCNSRWILDESYHKKMLINVYYILYFFDSN